MKVKRLIIIAYTLFLCTGNLFAQVNDAGLWASLNVEKKITPLLSFNISEEGRMYENINELGTFLTDAGFSYKINKTFRFSANYRFINKRLLNDSYSKRHRYYFDLTIREKFKPVILQFRTRFQSQYSDMFSSENGLVPSFYSRNKLTIKFDLDKKYSPYFYTELFMPVINSDNNYYIENIRCSAGIEYTINRMHSFDLFYMIQKECNISEYETDFIFGIGYNINL
jgi:hypothetical protein